jgi:hypothetical protein
MNDRLVLLLFCLKRWVMVHLQAIKLFVCGRRTRFAGDERKKDDITIAQAGRAWTDESKAIFEKVSG